MLLLGRRAGFACYKGEILPSSSLSNYANREKERERGVVLFPRLRRVVVLLLLPAAVVDCLVRTGWTRLLRNSPCQATRTRSTSMVVVMREGVACRLRLRVYIIGLIESFLQFGVIPNPILREQ